MKVVIQKLTVPEIIEDINCALPAKERVLTAQDLNLFIILSKRESYSKIFNFLDDRGSPKYRMGREPIVKT